MECPACGSGLVEIASHEVVVDVCRDGCGGIWFDHLELKQMDEPAEPVEGLLMQFHTTVERAVDHEARRGCPRCEEVVLMRHFVSGKRAVAVDECPECGGFWLDGGELPQIRSEYRTEAERKKAAVKLAFGSDEPLAEITAEHAACVEREKKFAWILNLLCFPGRG